MPAFDFSRPVPSCPVWSSHVPSNLVGRVSSRLVVSCPVESRQSRHVQSCLVASRPVWSWPVGRVSSRHVMSRQVMSCDADFLKTYSAASSSGSSDSVSRPRKLRALRSYSAQNQL